MKITNDLDISLPMAVWLLHDTYDYVDKPNYISATTLMKPLRQIVLPDRIPASQQAQDVSEFIARKLGTAIHDSIERSWLEGHKRSMRLLGYPEAVTNRVLVNPTDEDLEATNNAIPVYLEQRAYREISVGGLTYTVGGKFDMVSYGIVNDFKSTSVWTWTKGTKDEDYALQGSIYKWLNPDKIVEDFIRVNFIFTDWSKMNLRTPNYPQKRVEYKDVPLMNERDTENWIRNKLALIGKYKQTPEEHIPECTSEELWRSDPVFKYYSDPAKASDPAARASKNFETLFDANAHLAEKGGKGIVITKLGEPKACGYCRAFEACTQKDRLGLGQS
jgi:hypothetical protein